jgi:hypothetical protein
MIKRNTFDLLPLPESLARVILLIFQLPESAYIAFCEMGDRGCWRQLRLEFANALKYI